MVSRPSATLSWTLRLKTHDRPLYFAHLCFCFDQVLGCNVCDDNLKIDCELILFLVSLESGVCCFCPIEKKPTELS